MTRTLPNSLSDVINVALKCLSEWVDSGNAMPIDMTACYTRNGYVGLAGIVGVQYLNLFVHLKDWGPSTLGVVSADTIHRLLWLHAVAVNDIDRISFGIHALQPELYEYKHNCLVEPYVPYGTDPILWERYVRSIKDQLWYYERLEAGEDIWD